MQADIQAAALHVQHSIPVLKTVVDIDVDGVVSARGGISVVQQFGRQEVLRAAGLRQRFRFRQCQRGVRQHDRKIPLTVGESQ